MKRPRLEALRIIDKHGTNNPFRIIKERNGLYFFDDLDEIWGYYHKYVRTPIVHINSKLGDFEALFTCAHEVGHDILHPDISTPFLRRSTLYSVDKIEREANCFSVHLHLGDNKPMRDETITNFLCRCGIPSWLHCFY